MDVARTMTMEQALDQFPVGMRVLAVDDDQTCLRILQTLLHHCQYHVTTTNKAQTALELLRENKNKFDLVISDVDMSDMDGFKLFELVGLEMDLPVIMLSAHSSDPSRVYVMKGVAHGACDYLLKPVRIQELKNIWQHVVRNRKPRFVWTPELHKKFLVAVDRLGVEKAVPKRILDMMDDDTLTRENVANHLQKFRLALKKLNSEIGSHFMQMSSLKGGLGRLALVGSGQTFHGTTMPHYTS